MNETKPINHINAGLIISAILVIYSIILSFTGQNQNQALGWISYIILVGGLIFFINAYGKSRDNDVTFGQLFGYGFKITSIVTLVMILFMVLFFIIFPEYKDKIIDASRETMEKQKNLNDEQIDQAMELFNRNFIMFTAGGALFMYLVFGAIASLIGAAITKKRPQSPFEQQSN